jgi:hypothetical protein
MIVGMVGHRGEGLCPNSTHRTASSIAELTSTLIHSAMAISVAAMTRR